MGKLLVVLGVVVIVVGVLLMVGGRFHLGHLPGDIVIRGKHSTFYFPVVTCIVLSVVLSLIFWLFSRR